MTTALDHVRAHWAGIQPNSPIYGLFFSGIRIVYATSTAEDSRIVARLPVMLIHVNSKQILHGAVSAALVDWAGGMAIAAATGRDKTGVSVDIHISYVSTAREGDELEIEAWVQRVGRTLAYTSVEIRLRKGGEEDETRPTKGAVVATGSHTKYVAFGEAKKAAVVAAPPTTVAVAAADDDEHRSANMAADPDHPSQKTA